MVDWKKQKARLDNDIWMLIEENSKFFSREIIKDEFMKQINGR